MYLLKTTLSPMSERNPATLTLAPKANSLFRRSGWLMAMSMPMMPPSLQPRIEALSIFR
jgi:hypothetical protein